MDIDITAGTTADIESLGPLWPAMLEHPRRVVGERWPARGEVDSLVVSDQVRGNGAGSALQNEHLSNAWRRT